ncbi:BASIC LEUCINE ZIPPER 34-LIKE [Salix viminalis]|uniref:BASIC LEUCINE ZIPPER 34-LIKE n=1 Tax=Salix viminalis TaxID=40686 RepID=A0A9Q0SBM3_SALVM|nr:BASIC LEUCINE ZIPPER 34-LIKE [Salix viminalis]
MENVTESSATAPAPSQHPSFSIENDDSVNDKQIPAQTNQPNAEINKEAPHQGRPVDPNQDPKRLRRIMVSRQYSQKYRQKQMQYIMQLETEVKSLQAEVVITGPRIKYSNLQNSLLRMENTQYEELKKERDRMKQTYTVNKYQYPYFFNTMPPASYPFMNMNLNQPRYDLYMESAAAAARKPPPMMDES